jgi:ABC-2 type transport system ATP-binding protein
MVRSIRERGKTVLLTTHLMEEAQRLCDRVAIVERGHVVDVGTPGELVRKHCPEQTVIVAAEPAAASHFQAIPDVESAVVTDGQIIIRSRRGTSSQTSSSASRSIASASPISAPSWPRSRMCSCG